MPYTVHDNYKLQSCMVGFRVVSTFFIAFFSDFRRKGFVGNQICNRMVPSFFSNFNFQRCRYQVKLGVDDIMRDLYGEK